MKRLLKFALPCTLAVLLIVWMVFSTQWIANARNTVAFEQIPRLEDTNVGLSFYEITDFHQEDTLFDTVRLSGIVYNISEATDDEASRSIILNGETVTYRLQMPELRRNAFMQYGDIDLNRKYMVGFGSDVCLLNIADDTYHILMQVEENGIPATELDTGYVVEKINGYATMYYRPSEKIDTITTSDGYTNAGFSSMALANGTLTMHGWGILNDVDAHNTEVVLEVYRGDTLLGTYTTTKESITYIASYYKDDRYYACGFMAAVDGVTDAEDLKVRVYVGQDGVYSKYTNCFVPDEGNTNLVAVPDVMLSPAIAPVEDAQGWANGGINTCILDENGTLILQGWGIIDSINADDTACAVAVYDGETLLETYNTQKESAPNIADYFSNEAYTNSGFSAMAEGISAKDLRVRLYVSHEGTWYKCGYYFIPDPASDAMTSVTE